MKKLRYLLVALLICITLTWIPSFAMPSAQAADKVKRKVTVLQSNDSFGGSNPDEPGLQFAIEPGTGNFVQFQSGPISEGEKVFVSYDSLRVSQPANPDCSDFSDLDTITMYVMSDNSGDVTEYNLGPSSNYVKTGEFTDPQCYEGSEEIQVWFEGKFKDSSCYDSAFSRNYHFPVICK